MSIVAADAATAADWLEAWATLGGAILSAAAVLVAVLVVRQEQRHRREDRQEAEAAQARLVLASLIRVEGTHRLGYTDAEHVIRNNSSEIVSDVRFILQERFTGRTIGEETIEEVSGGERHSIAFAFKSTHPWPPAWQQQDVKSNTMLTWRHSLEFTDSRGLRWRRDGVSAPLRMRDHVRNWTTLDLLAEFLYLSAVAHLVRAAVQRLRSRIGVWLLKRLNGRPFKPEAVADSIDPV